MTSEKHRKIKVLDEMLQVKIPEREVELLNQLCEKLNRSKSQILQYCIEKAIE